MSTTTTHARPVDSLLSLVAIARAAWLSGDRDLLRVSRDKLLQEHGVRLSFARREGQQR